MTGQKTQAVEVFNDFARLKGISITEQNGSICLNYSITTSLSDVARLAKMISVSGALDPNTEIYFSNLCIVKVKQLVDLALASLEQTQPESLTVEQFAHSMFGLLEAELLGSGVC